MPSVCISVCMMVRSFFSRSPLSIPICPVLLPLFNLFCVSGVCARQKGLSFRRVYLPVSSQIHKGFSHFLSPPPLFILLLLCDLFMLAWISCSSFVRFTFNRFCSALFLSKHSSHSIEFSLGAHAHERANLRRLNTLIFVWFLFFFLRGCTHFLPGDFPFCSFFSCTIDTIR